MIKLNDVLLEFKQFPNGELMVPGERIKGLLGCRPSTWPEQIRFRYETDADLMALLFVKRHIDSIGVPNGVALFIEYMPYSRMDRSEGDSVFTLRHVAAFINDLRFDKVYVLEPHSDVTVALLDRAEGVSGAPYLLDKAMRHSGFIAAEGYVVYPDAGAQKRYAKEGRYRELVCYKHRNFATGRIERLDLVGTVSKSGFTAIIVDDLCSYGGTFVMTAERLRAAGAKDVYLCVTHCENSILKGKIFTHDDAGVITGCSGLINGVFTTNSILSEEDPTGLIRVFDTANLWPN